ncbi:MULTISPECIES: response regulator [unclassified Pseudomonas]|uniref:response regulator n=1 Tax=unclassified Pseudomonas TaxID=196821 RepID=UPI00289ECAE7|nr:response regulator [Pseudomonas sp.]
MTTTRKRVLLVEDETLIAMLLEDILDELGYDVAGSAADFDEGMRLASSETFDLAILDVNVGGREIFPIAEQLAAARHPLYVLYWLWGLRVAGRVEKSAGSGQAVQA